MSEPIWSTGGAAGERAVTEDLAWASSALRAAANDVAAARLELARRLTALELGDGTGLGPSVGHAAAIAELSYVSRRRAPALEADLDDVARRLGLVAQAFVEAERAAQRQLGAWDTVRDGAEDVVGLGGWLAGAARGQIGALPTTGLVDRDAVESLAGTPFATQLTVVLAMLSYLLEHLALEPLGFTQGSVTAVNVPAARSLEDVMRRLRETELSGGGAVRIERWTDAAGVTRRVVFIPGTQDWGFWSKNPSDVDADLWLMLGVLPQAAHLVQAALVADGAKPDDPVMLTGHSLGGMVATALAANADFRAQFRVRAVVTAGSPVGGIALPASVNALHLEGTRDIVPGLDGRPNPATPTRLTVSHDARDSELTELEGEGSDIGSAHSLDTYAQTARLVDEGVSPSTHAWVNAEREFLVPGAGAVVTEYRP